MQRLITISLIAFIIAGCSSTPTTPTTSAHFTAPTVELTMQQKLVKENYPDQAALSALIKSKLEGALQEQGVLAGKAETDALTVVVTMHYQRVFAGEDTPIPSSSVAPPRISYNVVVKKGDSTVKTYARSDVTINRGFASNLQGTFTLGLGNSPQTEADDIAILAKGMVSELVAKTAAQ